MRYRVHVRPIRVWLDNNYETTDKLDATHNLFQRSYPEHAQTRPENPSGSTYVRGGSVITQPGHKKCAYRAYMRMCVGERDTKREKDLDIE